MDSLRSSRTEEWQHWVSLLFLLSPVVPGKEKPVRDLVGNLNPFSLPRASAGWDPLPNCFWVITGTPAGKLIHPKRSIDGTIISLPSTRWDERPRPNVFWLSTVPLCPPHPQQKMTQDITSAPAGSTVGTE